jgi:hypothetical protein
MASQRTAAKTDDFTAARRAFERWRKSRSSGCRIPESLWNSAVRLARKHGVNPTARALGLDYYSLKKRLENDAASRRKRRQRRPRATRKPAFVELPFSEVTKRVGCAVVLEQRDGVKLRFEFDSSPDAGDLEAVARALLGAAQ